MVPTNSGGAAMKAPMAYLNGIGSPRSVSDSAEHDLQLLNALLASGADRADDSAHEVRPPRQTPRVYKDDADDPVNR
jgi:hypothetical protein